MTSDEQEVGMTPQSAHAVIRELPADQWLQEHKTNGEPNDR